MLIGVLGPIEIGDAWQKVRIGSEKQRRLLAALVVDAGSVVSADRLIHVLWGDDPPASALRSLRTYVYRLRYVLAPLWPAWEPLVTRPPGYLLAVPGDAATVIDACRFEQLLNAAHQQDGGGERLRLLDEALALWRGPAYAEFADEEFVRAETVRLNELCWSAVEERGVVLLRLDRHAEVVSDLGAFVEQHPLRERARELLMLALYRAGRHAEALTVCRDFRSVLLEELGLDLPASIAALEVDILRQSPELASRHDTLGQVVPAHRDRGSSAERTDREPTTAAGALASEQLGAPPPPGLSTLPAETTRLVGRAHDIESVVEAARWSSLVTITGVGGVGKSRVALRAAREAAATHRDGVWWCDLAAVTDEADVAHAVATVMGARPSEGHTVSDTVVGLLRPRRALVVLDNCEHVLAAVASLVRLVVTGCPDVTVLATSRAPLGIAGEQVRSLDPLPVELAEPDDGTLPPALELFLDCGRSVRPDLDESPTERAQMADLCRRLDGLPLAIELAASRLRSLNPTDLAARLDDRLDLIADARTHRGRHSRLRSVLDWSYGLLSHTEQQTFARLSVFAGSFTVASAEAVASAAGTEEREVVDLLTSLVDQSLVARLPGGGPARYSMLETLRLYGREELRSAGDEARVLRRHAEHYVELAETADELVRGSEEAAGSARLDRDLDNLRAAHRWSVEHGAVDLALRLSAALFRYALWRLRAEVFRWAEMAASLPGAEDHPTFPTVAGMVGWGAGLRGDLHAAESWADRGAAVLRDDHDPRWLVPLEVRMHAALWQGRLEECLQYAERASAVTDSPYDLVPDYTPCLALTYAGRPTEALQRLEPVYAAAQQLANPTMLSLVLYTQGEAWLELDPPRAVAPLQQAAGLADTVNGRMLQGVIDVSLISLQTRHGTRSPETLASFLRVIDRLQDAGDLTHLWTGLRGLAGMLDRHGTPEDAAVILGAVRGAASAPPIYGEDVERLATVERRLVTQLGTVALEAAQARGEVMNEEDAMAFARAAIRRCLHN